MAAAGRPSRTTSKKAREIGRGRGFLGPQGNRGEEPGLVAVRFGSGLVSRIRRIRLNSWSIYPNDTRMEDTWNTARHVGVSLTRQEPGQSGLA